MDTGGPHPVITKAIQGVRLELTTLPPLTLLPYALALDAPSEEELDFTQIVRHGK